MPWGRILVCWCVCATVKHESKKRPQSCPPTHNINVCKPHLVATWIPAGNARGANAKIMNRRGQARPTCTLRCCALLFGKGHGAGTHKKSLMSLFRRHPKVIPLAFIPLSCISRVKFQKFPHPARLFVGRSKFHSTILNPFHKYAAKQFGLEGAAFHE